MEVEVAKAFKTNPTPVAWGETYTALQQGTVDAEGNTFPHMYGAKHHETLKYAATTAHNYGMQVMMANKAWWDKLPKETQDLILGSGRRGPQVPAHSALSENEAEAREGFIKSGVKIVDLNEEQQLEEFKKAAKPVWDKFQKQLPPELSGNGHGNAEITGPMRPGYAGSMLSGAFLNQMNRGSGA